MSIVAPPVGEGETMKVCVAFAMLGSLMVLGCGDGDDGDDHVGVSSPVEGCKTLIASTCRKAFNGCYTAAQLAAAAAVIGNSIRIAG